MQVLSFKMEEFGFPNFNLFNFSFGDVTPPNWEEELQSSDEELASCVEALENEESKTTTRFPNLSGTDLQEIVSNAESKGSKRNTKWFVKMFEGKNTQ